jgi:hypothetical protein
MARSCTGSGYRFEFSGKRNWRSSKDDNWNTEVGKNMCGRVVGRRRRGLSEFGQKHGIPIGRICQVSGGYEYSSVGASRAMHGPKKTKASAVLAVVKSYKSWIGG